MRSARSHFRRRAALVRLTVQAGAEPAPTSDVELAGVGSAALTLTQTIALLAISRELAFPLQPQMRRRFLRLHLILPIGEPAQRTYQITDAGRVALGASQYLAAAQRALDGQRRG